MSGVTRQKIQQNETEIINLYKSGNTLFEISKQFKINQYDISKYLEAKGIHKIHKREKFDTTEAEELARQGYSVKEIEEMGIKSHIALMASRLVNIEREEEADRNLPRAIDKRKIKIYKENGKIYQDIFDMIAGV